MSYKSNLSFNKDYVKHWVKPFDKSELIYVVFGKSDSGDFATALGIVKLYNLGGDKIKFTCFNDVAKHIYENKDDFTDLFCLVDSSYEDPDASNDFTSKVVEANHINLFRLLTNHEVTDPIFFVRESNNLLQWLKKVRGCSAC